LADAVGNWLSGSKMAKAVTNKEWKRRYEEKSRVPTIESGDPRTVITPFLENVNAADYFSFSHEMENLGALSELKDDGIDEKTEMAKRVIDELGKIHAEGMAWGEFIPDNVIITEGGKPVIAESEVAYYKDVPLVEQKARDMRDFIISAAGDLNKGEKLTGYSDFAQTLIDRHPDPEVRKEVVRLAKEKPSWWRKALRAVHELPRLGVGGKEYDKIIAAIAATEV
jgi:tRNA A-37 threonylcarbamoyl transferase component Bud32